MEYFAELTLDLSYFIKLWLLLGLG